jgi:hypothetical protein
MSILKNENAIVLQASQDELQDLAQIVNASLNIDPIIRNTSVEETQELRDILNAAATSGSSEISLSKEQHSVLGLVLAAINVLDEDFGVPEERIEKLELEFG